jgi:radical SAM superfamily enzyme YgiQ (UPF0313 family)
MKWTVIAAAKRVIEREQGAISKDWGGRLPLALIFPNTYRVGMSSLALQTLYRSFNARPDIVCERVFCGLRTIVPGEEPVSLEGQHRLGDFGVLASSFSFELDYLNYVMLLKAAGIPVLARDRGDEYPLLLAGGPAVSANPEPLAEVCDAFVIGEVEPILTRLLDTLCAGYASGRERLLQNLEEIPGVYVPTRPGVIERQSLRDLDIYPTQTAVYAKDTEFGDMHLLEIARGCAHGCRFCLAGCLYRPHRERSPRLLLEQARQGRQYRRKVGLVSAAVSDYSRLDELLAGLAELQMLVSVSSLRVDPLPEELLAALAASGARTLTLAPEAGSERLRTYIRKGVHEDDICRAAEAAARFRFPEVKLYFMLGLPTEEEEDVNAIPLVFDSIARVFDGQLSASVATFVPKAHTPFERTSMTDDDVLKNRYRILKRALQSRSVRLSADGIPWSTIQAVLARGDRRLGLVLAGMTENSLAQWNVSMAAQGLSNADFTRLRAPEENLPWGHIRLGPGGASPGEEM